jgi:hypothetical protein
MPGHIVRRHAHRAGATGCRSLGSAWPTVARSGRRIASARRSRGGNRGTLGGIGGTPPGASGGRTPPGSPQTVAVVALRPWCPFRLALDLCGQQPTLSRHLARHQSASRQGACAVPPLCTRQPCGSVRTAHGHSERTPKGEDGGASDGLCAPLHDARQEAFTTSRRPARSSCTLSMRVFFVSLTSPPGAA